MSVSTTYTVDRVRGAQRPEHRMFGNKVIGSGVPNSDSEMEEDEESEDEDEKDEDEESEDEEEEEMFLRLVSLSPRSATLEHALAKKFKDMFGRRLIHNFNCLLGQKDQYWEVFRKVNEQALASYELAFSGETDAETESMKPDFKRNVSINAVYALVAKKLAGIKNNGTMFRSDNLALNVIADCWMMGKILTLTIDFIYADGDNDLEDPNQPTDDMIDRDSDNQYRLNAAYDMETSRTDLSNFVDTYIDNKKGSRLPIVELLDIIAEDAPSALDKMYT